MVRIALHSRPRSQVQGFPDLDHLSQLWMAPRTGQAWRRTPNNTKVVLPPMSERIERNRKILQVNRQASRKFASEQEAARARRHAAGSR